MINAWNLLWIIPVSAGFGVFLTALCVAGHNNNDNNL